MESNELKKIKKIYGENFMHLCKKFFPTILENKGKLLEILSLSFSENCKTLYEDIINDNLENDFKEFIYSRFNEKKDNNNVHTSSEKTPYELLNEAGYKLYECTTEDEIQQFKKYYEPDETLCTFNGGRLNNCFVFFAIKNNIENINRKNFKNPSREDEYGTSALSIQFNKNGKCMVSIKNRYNHTVNNPDATFGNNLDNIIPGLTQSFEKLLIKRGIQLYSINTNTFNLPNYTIASDGKFYKYNSEINNIYYCPSNIIIQNGQVQKLKNPEKNLLIDYFLLDTKNKTLQLYDSNIPDTFINNFKDIENIKITKDTKKGNGSKIITINKDKISHPILIKINKNNQITEYSDENLTQIDDYFLYNTTNIANINIPNSTHIGDYFLFNNTHLKNLNLPNVTHIGNNFLYKNTKLSYLNLLNLQQTKDYFLHNNEDLEQLHLPNLESVGRCFLYSNKKLTNLSVPKLIYKEDFFLPNNKNFYNLKLKNMSNSKKISFKKAKNILKNASTKLVHKINPKNIAALDMSTKLTTSEINLATSFFKKLQKNKSDDKFPKKEENNTER